MDHCVVEIEVGGRSYCLEPQAEQLDPARTTEQLWWIAAQQPDTQMTFQQAYYRSWIYYNAKYNRCQYPKLVMERLKPESENLFTDQ